MTGAINLYNPSVQYLSRPIDNIAEQGFNLINFIHFTKLTVNLNKSKTRCFGSLKESTNVQLCVVMPSENVHKGRFRPKLYKHLETAVSFT